jgi:hypothetical protein
MLLLKVHRFELCGRNIPDQLEEPPVVEPVHPFELLQMMLAEEGRLPAQLSLSDVKEWDPAGSRSILRALSAIESYEQKDGRYSFTAVSASKEHRIRVVDGVIEK